MVEVGWMEMAQTAVMCTMKNIVVVLTLAGIVGTAFFFWGNAWGDKREIEVRLRVAEDTLKTHDQMLRELNGMSRDIARLIEQTRNIEDMVKRHMADTK